MVTLNAVAVENHVLSRVGSYGSQLSTILDVLLARGSGLGRLGPDGAPWRGRVRTGAGGGRRWRSRSRGPLRLAMRAGPAWRPAYARICMDLRLDGKVALVTGASRGIGRAIATEFAASGATVMISSRKADALTAAAASMPGEVGWYVANAGDTEAAAACVAATVERFGSVDILVNNAATNPYLGPLIGLDEARANKIVQVNQWGLVSWTQQVWEASMRDRGGVILNLASVGGLAVEPVIAYYKATKAAVIHLTRHLASELGPRVRVNAIAPGLVKTDLARALWEAQGDAIAERLPLRRLGQPEDVAAAALFLASDAASWITGTTLVVDGGALVAPAGWT